MTKASAGAGKRVAPAGGYISLNRWVNLKWREAVLSDSEFN